MRITHQDLSAVDRRALTEMLVDKIVIAPHPHKIDKDGRRHYTHPRHPLPRSSRGGRAAQGGARGSGQDRPQSLSSRSVIERPNATQSLGILRIEIVQPARGAARVRVIQSPVLLALSGWFGGPLTSHKSDSLNPSPDLSIFSSL